MTQEKKQLLLNDLCARIPYGVQCEIGGLSYGPYTFTGDDVEDLIKGRTFKPYLRPMSSMTEEERKIYMEIGSHLCGEIVAKTMIDWLNKNYFDYRGLIEKGLALEAPEGMYKFE